MPTRGHRMQKLRESHGRTQHWVAVRIGRSQSYLAKQEAAGDEVDEETYSKVAALFHLTIEELDSFDERIMLGLYLNRLHVDGHSVTHNKKHRHKKGKKMPPPLNGRLLHNVNQQ